MKAIHTFVHPNGSRRVEIFQRENGTFGFEEWKFLSDEQAWIPITSRRSIPMVSSEEEAIKEAKGRIDWL